MLVLNFGAPTHRVFFGGYTPVRTTVQVTFTREHPYESMVSFYLDGENDDDSTSCGDTEPHEEEQSAYSHTLKRITNQVADFQKDENGDVLGMWLLTVVVGHSCPLPGQFHLKSGSLDALKISGEMLKSLGLTFDFKASGQIRRLPPPVAWAHVVPTLYSYDALQGVNLADVLSLPRKVRQHLGGKKLSLSLTEVNPVSEAGVSVYYLPVVVRHPKGLGCGNIPTASSNLAQFVHAWVARTIGAEVSFITPIQRPLPYSIALEAAEDLAEAP